MTIIFEDAREEYALEQRKYMTLRLMMLGVNPMDTNFLSNENMKDMLTRETERAAMKRLPPNPTTGE